MMTAATIPTRTIRPIDEILELARWAPSGDNTQPWRFEVVSATHVVVHGRDTRDHCVYDLDGHPSHISMGALLETAAIAATAHGLRMEARRRESLVEGRTAFDLHLCEDPRVRPSDLRAAISRRSVQRKPLARRPLTSAEITTLTASVAPSYDVVWVTGSARSRAALLMFRSAKLRLIMPEAYPVHRDAIEWGARFSADRIPDQALGVGPANLRLMRFVMSSWPRVRFFNRFLAGTLLPRIQMDLVPALACAGHFALIAQSEPKTIDDFVAAGRATQRFWLTATKLGLQLQPEITPLVFARYSRRGTLFSALKNVGERAKEVDRRLKNLIGDKAAGRCVFMGRIGEGTEASSRSVRLTQEQLHER